MRRGLKTRRQAGDTIVEVLIAVAIISLILAISYATTTRNTRSIQDAQERSQAIQIAQRQIELLKGTKGTPNQINTATQKCFSAADGAPKASNGVDGNDNCEVAADGSKVTTAGFEPAYHIAITGSSSTVYKVTITWDSLLNSSKDKLSMFYRP